MKISALIKKLEKIQAKNGNVEVMFAGPNHDQDPYEVNSVEFEVSDNDTFPEDYNMPAGFKFVLLNN